MAHHFEHLRPAVAGVENIDFIKQAKVEVKPIYSLFVNILKYSNVIRFYHRIRIKNIGSHSWSLSGVQLSISSKFNDHINICLNAKTYNIERTKVPFIEINMQREELDASFEFENNYKTMPCGLYEYAIGFVKNRESEAFVKQNFIFSLDSMVSDRLYKSTKPVTSRIQLLEMPNA